MGHLHREARRQRRAKVVDNGSWASWPGPDDIVFVRNTRVRRKLSTGEETPLVDSTRVPDLDGALLQQPELSRDGKFIAITLRGSSAKPAFGISTRRAGARPGSVARSTGRRTGAASIG